MRSETEGPAWKAIPVRIRARRRRVLNVSQLNRSVALVVLGLVAVVMAVVMIALIPVDDRVDVSAHQDGAASAPLTGQSILHFPR